jgi:hypothetical protein
MGAVPDLRAVRRAPRSIEALLAGLQAGTLGTFWMLAWMGLTAVWQRRSFWAPENLIANAFHPTSEIAADFQWSTFSGLALYVFIYGALGALFAFLTGRHAVRRARITLMALVFALAWYYFSFHLLWKTVAPAITLLDPERPTVIGHVIYGLILGRFTTYLPRQTQGSEAVMAQETQPDSVAPKTS